MASAYAIGRNRLTVWINFLLIDGEAGEDGYFAFHLDLIGDKVASIDEAAKFSTQDRFLYHSFAAHGLRALNTSDRSAFILYCPEAKEIFPALWPQET